MKLAWAILLGLIAAPAAAEYPGCLAKTTAGNCLPGVYDPNNAAYGIATPLALDTAAPAGRAFAAICTAAGNVALTLSGGSALTVPVAVGLTILPLGVIKVSAAGTTATCSYANLS